MTPPYLIYVITTAFYLVGIVAGVQLNQKMSKDNLAYAILLLVVMYVACSAVSFFFFPR